MLSRRQWGYGSIGIFLSQFTRLGAAPDDTISISLSSRKVDAGEPVTVNWTAPDSAAVYLVGWGRVESKGQKQLVPEGNTDIFFVMETKYGPVVKKIDVKVNGIKGDAGDFEENLAAFRHPYPTSLPSFKHYGAMMDSLVSSILHKLGALQRRIQIDSNIVSVETSRFLPRDLQQRLPESYFGRRISYIVEAPGPDTFRPNVAAQVTIRSLIEFRRKVEPSWYPERDETFYDEQTTKLANFLRQP